MKFSDFFKKKTATQAELTAQFKKIQERRVEMEVEAGELKRAALTGGVEDLSKRLAELRDEVELLAVAEVEIERMLRELLASEIESAFLKVPAEVGSLREREATATVRAGEALAEAVRVTGAFGIPWANILSQKISEAVSSVFRCNDFRNTNFDAYGSQLEDFQAAYDGFPGPSENFSGKREQLRIIERRAPDSVEAQKFIDGRVKVLLFKPTAPVPLQPAPPKLPGRCKIEW